MASQWIQLGPDLRLPVDVATEVIGGLGQRKGGKTYGSGVLAEGLLDAGVQVVVLDQTDKFYGLRLQPDGKTPSIYQEKLIILGGKHCDLPLAPESGALVADLVLESGRSFVLDLSLFSKSQRARFCTEFGERLWMRRKQAEEGSYGVLHIICEEAQLLMPQNIRSSEKGEWSEARMYGVWEEIIRLGRNYGIGATLLTQRPQSVNKECLTQIEIVLAYKTNGTHERKALRDWLTAKDGNADLVTDLPFLNPKEGEAFLWFPGDGIFKKVKIGLKRTFDSSRTPRVGERRVMAHVKPVDLKALGEQMAAIREQAEKSDPGALKRKVALLEKELEKARSAKPVAAAKSTTNDGLVRRLKKALELAMKFIVRVDAEGFFKAAAASGQAVDKEGIRQALEAAMAQVAKNLEARMERRNADVLRLKEEAGRILREMKALTEGDVTVELALRHNEPFTVAPKPARPPRQVIPAGEGGPLANGERVVLTAIAQHADGVSKEQITVLTGYKRSSRTTFLQKLRRQGFITGDEQITATPEGVATLGADFEPLPTGSALLAHWRTNLPAGERACLDVLVAAYPEAVPKEEVGERTTPKYQRSSRTTFLQHLAMRRLVEEPSRGQVRASAMLFDP